MEQILVYGTRWCGDCHRARRILDEHDVPFTWIDIDKNAEGEKFVKQTNQGNRSVPTILFPDGSMLVEPSKQQLVIKLEGLSN